MGPVYYVIAVLGCADGSSQCTPVATLPTRYSSEEECSADTNRALVMNSNFDFPTLVAECRKTDTRMIADKEKPKKPESPVRRG